jgi:signal transduction histidine kinase
VRRTRGTRSARAPAAAMAMAMAILALLLLVIAGVFLTDTQERQREDLRARYEDRSVVARALLDSLFRVAFAGARSDASERWTGDRIPTDQLNQEARIGNARWIAVVDAGGRVLGSSSGTPPDALERISRRPFFVRESLRAAGYGLGDVHRGVVESAVGFPTAAGPRVQVTGAPVSVYTEFLAATVDPLPGGPGARAFVLDGAGRPLASVERGGARPQPAPGLLRVLAEGRDSGTFVRDGEERFYSATTLSMSRWRLVNTIGEDVLYEPASGVSRWLPWLILAMTALAFAWIALLVRRLLGTTAALRRSNVELQHSNAELARSNADLEQFAYVASHDLSEPLRTVAGFSQLLAKQYRGRLDPDADLYVSHMAAGVERMQQLIDDLLLYSRAGRLPVHGRPVDLDEVLDEVLHAIGPAIRERGATVVAGDLPTVRGERSQLAQVLQNLIVNAVKFTATDVTPEIRVDAVRLGTEWRVTVRDNGIGIDAAQRDAVFKMFGRLHPGDSYPGTGIGLALVKRIVERHGGRVWVESAPGGGSVFSFTLPDAVASPEAPETATVPA